MNMEELDQLADPRNEDGRREVDRRVFRTSDRKIVESLKTLVDTELKFLLVQSLYDLDEYYFMLRDTFPDQRVRPNLHLRCRISGHRLDIDWLRYWSFTDSISGKKQIYSRSFKKGNSSRHSMRGFARYPAELKKIISFIEDRNEIKRKRSAVLSKMSQLLRMYEKLLEKERY